jgi:hypothetical protein
MAFENDGRTGLWASDGRAAGTGPVRAEPLAAGSNPTDFAWFRPRGRPRLSAAGQLGAGRAGEIRDLGNGRQAGGHGCGC